MYREAPGERFGGTPVARTVGWIAETLADTRPRRCAVHAVDIVSRLLFLETAAREESDRLRCPERTWIRVRTARVAGMRMYYSIGEFTGSCDL